MIVTSVVRLSELKGHQRIDADRYQIKYLELESNLQKLTNVRKLQNLILEPIRTGKTPSDRDFRIDDENVFFIKTDTVRKGLIDFDNSSFLPKRIISKNNYLKSNEILVTIIGATQEVVGRSALFLSESNLTVVNQNIAVIHVNEKKINPFYLMVFLNSKYGREQLWMLSRQTEQVNLNCREVEELLVPIFNVGFYLTIQNMVKRFHDLIDKSKILYDEAEDIILNKLNLKNLKKKDELTYTTNIFHVITSGRFDAEYFQPKYQKFFQKLQKIAVKNSWEIKTIKEISEPLRYGTSENLTYLNEGIPFLRITDIENFDFDEDLLHYISKEEANKVRYAKVKDGDLLVSRSGTLGLTLSINKELENSIFGSYLIRIRPDIEINRDYLAFYLNSFPGKIQVEQISTGSIQTNLTIPSIENIKVLMVEPEFQEKIADLWKESKSLRKKGKCFFKESITKIEKEIEKEMS